GCNSLGLACAGRVTQRKSGADRSSIRWLGSNVALAGFDGFLFLAHESVVWVLGAGEAEVRAVAQRRPIDLQTHQTVTPSLFAVTAMIAATLLFALLKF